MSSHLNAVENAIFWTIKKILLPENEIKIVNTNEVDKWVFHRFSLSLLFCLYSVLYNTPYLIYGHKPEKRYAAAKQPKNLQFISRNQWLEHAFKINYQAFVPLPYNWFAWSKFHFFFFKSLLFWGFSTIPVTFKSVERLKRYICLFENDPLQNMKYLASFCMLSSCESVSEYVNSYEKKYNSWYTSKY